MSHALRPRPSPRVVFFALLAVFLVVVAVTCSFDPIVGDDWLGLKWRRSGHGFTDLPQIFDFNYRIANPRLGETLLYVLSGWPALHVVVSPFLMLGVVLGLFVLALGRWPEPARRRDSALFVLTIALVCVGMRSLGENVFYRPFECNYLFGFLLQIWTLVPARLQTARSPWWSAPALFVLAFAAGMCNEHAGPALLVVYAALAILMVRATHRAPAWLAAGFVGAVAGYAALFFSPGLRVRGGGIGKEPILTRVLHRGLDGALEPFGIFWQESGLLLVVVVALVAILVLRRREPGFERAWRVPAALLAVAFVIVGTLIASPMQGPRLTLHSSLLVSGAALAALVPLLLERRRLFLAVTVLASLTVGYQAVRLGEAQHRLGADYAERFAILSAPRPPGQIVYLPPTHYWHKPHWAVTDELVQDIWRRTHAISFGARTIVLDTLDLNVYALASISTDWMADARFINQLEDGQPPPPVVAVFPTFFADARAYADEWGPKLVASRSPPYAAICLRALVTPRLTDGRTLCLARWKGGVASPWTTADASGAWRVPAAAWPYPEAFVTSLKGQRTPLTVTTEGSEKVLRASGPVVGPGTHLVFGCDDQVCVIAAAF